MTHGTGNKLSVSKVYLIGFASRSRDKVVLCYLDYDLAFSLRDDFVPTLHGMRNTFPRWRLGYQPAYAVDLLLQVLHIVEESEERWNQAIDYLQPALDPITLIVTKSTKNLPSS